MKKQITFFALVASLAVSFGGVSVEAKLSVIATLPSFADIASEVGGDAVSVVSLTKGNQDPHFVDAKPNLVLKLNRADLVVHAGLGLEDGWLPPLLTGARNGKVQTGSEGNLNVSTLMELKAVPAGKLDRASGDVHPGGNPHFMLDPRNGIVLAKGFAKKFAELEPSKAADFNQRADAYSAKLGARIKTWEVDLKSSVAGKPVVTYHPSWIYFLGWSGMQDAGNLEPKPGIPPSPQHVVKLIKSIKERGVKMILMEPFYPKGTAEEVASESGAQLLILPSEVHGTPEAKTYIEVFEQIVGKLKSLKSIK